MTPFPLAPSAVRAPSGSPEGWVLYAPRANWLALVAAGWRLPFIVETDRSGWSVLLWRPE